MPNRRYGRIAATLVGGALIILGLCAPKAPPGLAIAGAILIGSVLIAAALPGPPRRHATRSQSPLIRSIDWPHYQLNA